MLMIKYSVAVVIAASVLQRLGIHQLTPADGYTIRCYAGYVISPPGGPEGGLQCSAFEKAISAAWASA